MEVSSLSYKQLIFVCTNSRPVGERISCAGEGRCGERVLEKLKAYIKTNRLEKVVRVAKSGCQEKCETGPSVVVLPQNLMLSGVMEKDIDEIIEKFLAPLKSD